MPFAPFAVRIAAWLILLAAAQHAPAAAAEAVLPTMRVRIAWGGGTERQWQGRIEISEGALSEPQALGIEADEPGSIWIEQGQLVVREPSPRAYDGVDVLVSAPRTAKLLVKLSEAGMDNVQPIEIPLEHLLQQSHTSELDSEGNRVLVLRSPGDRLRVTLDRDSLVFSPGEAFKLNVQPHLLGIPAGTVLHISAQLQTAAGQKVLLSEQELRYREDGTDAANFELKLPEEEGVYDVKIEAATPRPRARLLRKRVAHFERKVQLVVLGATPSSAPVGTAVSSTVLEIDPVNPRWWERLTNLSLLPALRKGPLGNGDAARWDHDKLGAFIQLGPGGRGPNMSWEAYPLPLTTPGQPHILEIEYPSDVPQTMGISLLEPNAAGAVTPIGVDSGLYVTSEDAESPARLEKHRIICWPRTKTPVLLITNRRQGARAVYGKIRLLRCGPAPPSGNLTLPFNAREAAPAVLPRAFARQAAPPERLLAGYLDRPLMAENFSANEALDAFSHRSLDDWTTFYQGGTRLLEYLNHVGYNGLVVAVSADGSTMYPSRLLEPTPRYDTGVFFATGQDPLRKDALELMFRLFDREGLKLIPALQFASPLPEVEQLRRGGDAGRLGLEWIGADGRPLTEKRAPKQGLAPYYNPLNVRVQQAMLNVVHELTQRYSAHPSFGGIAVQLSADGYAQLPGPDGGYDDDTLARFTRDTGVAVAGSGPDRFALRAKLLTGPQERAWLNWRAAALADFHYKIEREVLGSRKDAKLYLAGATMLDNPQIQRALRPALPRRLKMEEVMLGLGIRPELYRDHAGIELLRPQCLAPLQSLPTQAAELEVNLAPEVDRLFALAPCSGSLFYHEPQRARLASFDAKSPFGSANTYTWLVSQFSPSSQSNRRRFAHSLATLDAQTMFDGGWLLPLGQEGSLRDLIAVYRQLPTGRFETLPADSQPITVRTQTRGQQTYAYLVNDSPWNASISLEINAPPGCRLEKLGGGSGGPLVQSAQGATWTVQLKPYDLCAVRFNMPQVKLARPRVTLDEQVQVALERRIQDLGGRAASLASPPALPLLENPDFETAADASADALPGWAWTKDAALQVRPDRETKHGGQQALRVTSTAASATLRSNAFDVPQTGRLSVSLWLRVEDRNRQPTLRLALDGKLNDKPYYRYAVVGGRNVPVGSDWAPFLFQIDDLPAEGLSDLRVRFDLIGPGDVWIDDIQVFDLAFSETERVELTKMIAVANYQLKAGQFADCLRVLDSYWPQFLVNNVPRGETTINLAQRKRAAPPVEEPAKKQGVLDQVKGYVPRFMQF